MKNFLFVGVCGLGIVAFGCAAPAAEDQATATSEEPLTSAEDRDLASARAATAKYHDVNVALADGYVPDPVCVASPAGAMGIHYINPPLTQQPPRADKPAILLYEPTADGLRLVGFEYFQAVIVNGAPWFMPATVPPPDGQYNPAPVLFGHTFDGPMPGHNPNMPWHYDLHVWAWKHNPTGTFSEWNPNVHCP